jgi:hypothetical protein
MVEFFTPPGKSSDFLWMGWFHTCQMRLRDVTCVKLVCESCPHRVFLSDENLMARGYKRYYSPRFIGSIFSSIDLETCIQ